MTIIKQVSQEQEEKNAAELGKLLAAAHIDKNWRGCFGVSELVDNYLAKAITSVARYGNKVTIDEILEAEEERASANLNGADEQAITVIHSLWVDKQAIINREDNLLWEAQKAVGTPEEEPRHRVLLDLLERGFVVSFAPTIFSWIDWEEVRKMGEKIGEGICSPVVAAFNLREDEWEVDKGDESLETETRKGLGCTVMSEDGMFRHLRLEERPYFVLHRPVQNIL